MIWKKNIFSYIMWVLYTVLALGGLYVGAVRFCEGMPYPVLSSMIVCCAVLLLGSLALWGARLLGKGKRKLPVLKQWQKRAIEGIILAVLLIAGFFLRLHGIADGVSTNIYFEYAMVGADKAIPHTSYRIVSVYLYLLHFVFLVFGNKLAAGIWLQMILQYAGLTFLYVAVKKLSGIVPAVTMLLFTMTSPRMVSCALEISPGMLLLFFCGLALYLTAVFVTGTGKRIAFSLIAGLAIGAVSYLDFSGVALFGVMIVGLWMRRRPEGERLSDWVVACIVSLGAAVAGFVLLSFLDVAKEGLVPGGILSVWTDAAPVALRVPFAGDEVYHRWDMIPLLMAGFGIFSFWRDRETEKLSVWTIFAFSLTCFYLFQILPEATDPEMLLLLSAGVLTGVSISQLGGGNSPTPAVESAKSDNLESDSKEEQGNVQENISEEIKPVSEREKEDGKPVGEPGKVVTVTVRGETKEVKLLDNPLPLPKRHEHKPMEFGKKAIDAYEGYDYPVADDDDYDI